jgi:hypothetical protein
MLQHAQPCLLVQLFGETDLPAKPLQVSHQRRVVAKNELFARQRVPEAEPAEEELVGLDADRHLDSLREAQRHILRLGRHNPNAVGRRLLSVEHKLFTSTTSATPGMAKNWF